MDWLISVVFSPPVMGLFFVGSIVWGGFLAILVPRRRKGS